jgi:hypothetical protein
MDRAWVFSLMFNEATLAPYFIRHYRTFAERVILYVDIDTTDGTEDIARAEGAEVRSWDGHGIGLDDSTFADFASEHWREAQGQAEWVAWVDADEFLYYPSMIAKLDELKAAGVTVPTTDYYVMVSDAAPSHPGQIYDEPAFRNGISAGRNVKTFIFDPNAVHVHWDVGKHHANILGDVKEDGGPDVIRALHFRWLGEHYLKERDAKNYARLSFFNKSHGLGVHVHPNFSGPYSERWNGPRPESAQCVIFPSSS